MRYFKKRERFVKYMVARAAGTEDGLLTAEQAVEAYYEFMKYWGDFTRAQKIRFKQQRKMEHAAHSKGKPLPIHDYTSDQKSDVQFWEEAFDDAEKRSHDHG